MKTLEAYLNHVMKQAGFYDIKPSADGGTLKERWSISFDNCPQEKFNEIYKGVFGVIWNERSAMSIKTNGRWRIKLVS